MSKFLKQKCALLTIINKNSQSITFFDFSKIWVKFVNEGAVFRAKARCRVKVPSMEMMYQYLWRHKMLGRKILTRIFDT